MKRIWEAVVRAFGSPRSLLPLRPVRDAVYRPIRLEPHPCTIRVPHIFTCGYCGYQETIPYLLYCGWAVSVMRRRLGEEGDLKDRDGNSIMLPEQYAKWMTVPHPAPENAPFDFLKCGRSVCTNI